MIKGVECNRKIYPCILVDDELHDFYVFRRVLICLSVSQFAEFQGVYDKDNDEFDYMLHLGIKHALNLNCFAYHCDKDGRLMCIFSPKA